MSVRDKVVAILSAMRKGVYERDEALALSLLAALSGESIFLLGLPGVGKSMIARRLKMAFADARGFEYLMSRFSTPDEIFGPVSISKLKDDERYERITAGYLPEAEVVFLDEIWKAGPAIQNALLTVLNEKIYLNGNSEMKLPLKAVIAASNELPAEDEGLEALWDRFLIRYVVDPVIGRENFFRLISAPDLPADKVEGFSQKEYAAIRVESGMVRLPDTVMEGLYKIRRRLNEKMTAPDPVTGEPKAENSRYYVSDRRWRKAAGILRTSAYLNGRNSVDFSDMVLLANILWNDDTMVREIQGMVAEAIVNTLFTEVLDRFRGSTVRSSSQHEDTTPYSPDGQYYSVLCDGSPMRVAIHDYERMRNAPQQSFYASETADGTLIFRSRGEYAVRFISDGNVSVNNCVYPLETRAGNDAGYSSFKSIGEALDSAAQELFSSMQRNVFLLASGMYNPLRAVVSIYKERFSKGR